MRVLNALPDTACVNGIIFPAAVAQIVNQPLADPIREALSIEFEQALHQYLESGFFKARAAALQKWYAARTGWRGLRDALRGVQKADRLIYKEPFLSFAPEFVYEALPGVRIIHLYRDGRDCADSLVRTYDVLTDEKLTHLRSAEMRFGRKVDHRYVPWWVEDGQEEAFLAAAPYGRAIWMWKAMVRRCHTFFTRPDVAASGQILLLRYEDLMRAPFHYGEAVAAHLGVPVNTRFRQRLKDAHARSIGIHKHRDAETIRAAERIAGEELRLYGY